MCITSINEQFTEVEKTAFRKVETSQASMGVAELEGTLSEQNTRLQEYYAHIQEQNNTIATLESELASMQGLVVELKRVNEEKNQLKVENEECKSSLEGMEKEEKESLHQHHEEAINEWKKKCQDLQSEKETLSRQLDSQLHSSQKASMGVAELEG